MEILKELATYNIWANKRLFDFINLLPTEKQELYVESSFSSLQLTILHMLDAESIWWQRLKLAERLIIPSQQPLKSTTDLINELLLQNQVWEQWVHHANPNQFEYVFAYQNSKKEQYKQPVWKMLTHVFNHGTYHRGQLVTIIRQLGDLKIPSTDFIEWCRKK